MLLGSVQWIMLRLPDAYSPTHSAFQRQDFPYLPRQPSMRAPPPLSTSMRSRLREGARVHHEMSPVMSPEMRTPGVFSALLRAVYSMHQTMPVVVCSLHLPTSLWLRTCHSILVEPRLIDCVTDMFPAALRRAMHQVSWMRASLSLG